MGIDVASKHVTLARQQAGPAEEHAHACPGAKRTRSRTAHTLGGAGPQWRSCSGQAGGREASEGTGGPRRGLWGSRLLANQLAHARQFGKVWVCGVCGGEDGGGGGGVAGWGWGWGGHQALAASHLRNFIHSRNCVTLWGPWMSPCTKRAASSKLGESGDTAQESRRRGMPQRAISVSFGEGAEKSASQHSRAAVQAELNNHCAGLDNAQQATHALPCQTRAPQHPPAGRCRRSCWLWAQRPGAPATASPSWRWASSASPLHPPQPPPPVAPTAPVVAAARWRCEGRCLRRAGCRRARCESMRERAQELGLRRRGRSARGPIRAAPGGRPALVGRRGC